MKSPAFQFYPGDWLSSPKVILMTPAQEGAYIRLLCYAWADPDCSLPDDDETLAALSRLGEGWLKGGSTVIRKCFNQVGTRLVNERLLREREKQRLWSEKSRQGGISSGKSRTSNQSKGASRVVEPKGNSSSSSSSSSSNVLTNHKKPPFQKPTEEEATIYSKEISLPSSEVQGFLNHHEARGWVLNNGKLMVDWKAAMRTWRGNAEKFGRIPKESEKKDYSIGTGCFAPDYGKEEAK